MYRLYMKRKHEIFHDISVFIIIFITSHGSQYPYLSQFFTLHLLNIFRNDCGSKNNKKKR